MKCRLTYQRNAPNAHRPCSAGFLVKNGVGDRVFNFVVLNPRVVIVRLVLRIMVIAGLDYSSVPPLQRSSYTAVERSASTTTSATETGAGVQATTNSRRGQLTAKKQQQTSSSSSTTTSNKPQHADTKIHHVYHR